MKQIRMLFALFAALLLAGCGKQPASCDHQWTDADCVNAKICSLCQAAEGDALGHDWADTACTAPKTCLRCGETEGEALDHSWEDATCAAPKTCGVCGAAEGEALPHHMDNWTAAQAVDSMYQRCLVCGQAEESVPYDREQYLLDYASGIWCAADQNGIYILTLNPDMTFDLNDEIQGIWSYAADVFMENWSVDVVLRYEKNGGIHTANTSIGLGMGPTVEAAISAASSSNSNYMMRLYYEGNNVWLNDVTRIGADAAGEQMLHPEKTLLGDWGGIYTEQYEPEHRIQMTTAHCAAFREDGTFTLTLEEPYEGTWYVDGIGFSEDTAVFRFGFVFEEEPKPGGQLSASVQEGILTVREEKAGYTNTYQFLQDKIPAHLEEKMALLYGEWTAISLRIDSNGTFGQTEVATDNRISLHPDGTLDAFWDGEKTGAWIYTNSSLSGNGQPVERLFYQMQFDGEDGAMTIVLEQFGSTLVMHISETVGNETHTRWFSQITAEEATFLETAEEEVLGVWNAVSAFRQNPETGYMDVPAEPENLCLVFEAGGDLTVSGDTNAQGSWQRNRTQYFSGSGCMFYLQYDGIYQSAVFSPDRTLNITRSTDDGYLLLILEKE